jgi:Helicase conserved C-terminal domain
VSSCRSHCTKLATYYDVATLLCTMQKFGAGKTRWMMQMASFCQGKGIPAMCYHAGLSATQRQAVADAMAQRRVRVVTCTTALSTGLDMSFIDGVVHHALPSSLEEYVQQARCLPVTHKRACICNCNVTN